MSGQRREAPVAPGERSAEPCKPYYRIGEVARLVGVQPHVLRYWESEFSSVRPRKSSKGQRVYSQKDVQRLLHVKHLLRDQGFSIAGAKKQLRERPAAPGALAAGALAAGASAGALAARRPADAKAMRRALVNVRQELRAWLDELQRDA